MTLFFQNTWIALTYMATAYFGLLLAVPPGYATAIWPCSGIALGAAMVYGLRILPGIFIGSFIINFLIPLGKGEFFIYSALIIALIIACGAVFQTLGGWYLIKRYIGFSNLHEHSKDIILFALLSGPVSCLINSTWSNILLYFNNVLSPENFLINWITWWIGDSIGVLIFTPVFLILFARPTIIWRRRIFPILFPLLISFALVLVTYKVVSASEKNLVRYIFNQKVQLNVKEFKEVNLNTKEFLERLDKKNYKTFNVYDITQNPIPVYLYKQITEEKNPASYQIETKHYFDDKNRKWLIDAIASSFFVNQQFSWQVWLALVTGFLICALINITLFIIDGQNKLAFESAQRISLGYERAALAAIRDIKERKKIDKMKNEFIAVVSHELKTPLTSIQGSLDLLDKADKNLNKDAQKLLAVAKQNSERLAQLINDILDIEKIELGKVDLQLKPMEINKLAKEAIALNQAYANRLGVKIKLLHSKSKLIVNVDHNRIIQVFTNLISNAVKFSPKNGNVTISITQQDNIVRVAISDKGPGIPEEFRSQIFQKFAQADTSSTREQGGTGLGLSISKAIVEKHGGRINFETNLNEGTTFYFDLPIATPKKDVKPETT